MNTILITGTAKPEDNKYRYNVNVWASKEAEQIQFIKYDSLLFDNYGTLWAFAKSTASAYFDNNTQFHDGAYTQFLDHITLIS
jgi:site-specific recombinase